MYELGVNFWEQEAIQELLMQYVEMLNFLAEQTRTEYEATDVDNYVFNSNYMTNTVDTPDYYDDAIKAICELTPEQFWNYLEKKNSNLTK